MNKRISSEDIVDTALAEYRKLHPDDTCTEMSEHELRMQATEYYRELESICRTAETHTRQILRLLERDTRI